MKILLLMAVWFNISSFSYGQYLFISSNPLGADVYIVEGEKKTSIGKTPLKIENFTKKTTIQIEKSGFLSQTGNVDSSEKIQNEVFNLAPLLFHVQFPHQVSSIQVKDKLYTSADNSYGLPYGPYNFAYNDKKGTLDINYQSPYTPYVAVFTTVTAISTIIAITAGILASQANRRVLTASNSTDLIAAIERTSMLDTMTWSSVGIGTGALIGTIVAGVLEGKEQKRIQRFNGMNAPVAQSIDYIKDYQEIIMLNSASHRSVLPKINDFIKTYKDDQYSLLPEVYLLRASVYLRQKGNYQKAIKDLRTVVENYPTFSTYEDAYKLLADVYKEDKQYVKAYEAYQEVLKVLAKYSYDQIKMLSLETLFQAGERNKKYKELFLEESQDLQGLSIFSKSTIEQLRNTLLQ